VNSAITQQLPLRKRKEEPSLPFHFLKRERSTRLFHRTCPHTHQIQPFDATGACRREAPPRFRSQCCLSCACRIWYFCDRPI